MAAPMLVPPLSTVLFVLMTQIVSTLASLLLETWHPGHIPASQSALYPLLTDDMYPLDLLQELVSLLAPDLATFLTVFGPLVQHCQQEAARTKLVSQVSVSAVVFVQVDGHEDQLRVSPSAQLATMSRGRYQARS